MTGWEDKKKGVFNAKYRGGFIPAIMGAKI